MQFDQPKCREVITLLGRAPTGCPLSGADALAGHAVIGAAANCPLN
jgi:hypothetical protein